MVQTPRKKVIFEYMFHTLLTSSFEHKPERNGGQVKKYLVKLDVFKSAKPDKIYTRVFKELAEVISEPLAIIFEKSLRIGDISED